MKKIALAAVAVLAITGSAFAGSDNYGSERRQPAGRCGRQQLVHGFDLEFGFGAKSGSG